MHPVEEVPTANVSARDMDAFLKSHAERMRKEKDQVAARAQALGAQESEDEEGGQERVPPPATPPSLESTEIEGLDDDPAMVSSTDATPENAAAEKKETAVVSHPPAESDPVDPGDGTTTDPAFAPTEPAMIRPGAPPARPSSGRRPAAEDARPGSRRQPATSSSRRQAARQPKKMSKIERWLYIFIAVCVIAGGINFYLKRPQPTPPPEEQAPPPLAPQDKLWLAAEELAGKAEALTQQASTLNQSGDKEQATQIYKQAEDIWQQVYANIDRIAELGVDFDDPGYGRWQKKITRWTKSFQECVKFQQVEDFDYEEELRKARERNRLDEEK